MDAKAATKSNDSGEVIAGETNDTHKGDTRFFASKKIGTHCLHKVKRYIKCAGVGASRTVVRSYSVSGSIRPSGRFSYGRVPDQKKTALDKRYDDSVGEYICERWRHVQFVDGEYSVVDTDVRIENKVESVDRFIRSSNSSQTERYGLKGITARGRSQINEACFLLQKKYGVRNLGMLTLTCPYVSGEELYLFAMNIGEIQRRFFQSLKRLYKRRGWNLEYVSCVEIQEERYRDKHQVCPHIHAVFVCRSKRGKQFICTADEFRDLWRSTLSQVVGNVPSVKASVDISVVRRNAAAYLSKYMSKGGEVVAEIASDLPLLLPRRWWGMSMGLRRAIAYYSVRINDTVAESLVHMYKHMPETIKHWKVVTVLISDCPCDVGNCGALRERGKNVLGMNIKEVCLCM